MKVISSGIVDGVIQDPYGSRGSQFSEEGICTYSLPFEILDAPAGTKSFAIILEDKDAIPVTRGFSWIHWTACNIQTTRVEANASAQHPDFVQGLNSWPSMQGGSQALERSCCYGGMSPPDRPHTYELHVFALDALLPLQDGYWVNELWWALDGHILARDTLKGIYRNS